MYYTHHFAHYETLCRACDWLGRLGLHAEPSPGLDQGTPRLTMMVNPGQLAAVELLVNALEGADPEGWPSFWDDAQHAHSAPPPVVDRGPTSTSGRPDPIGWHPIDARHGVRPELDRLREAMGD